MCIINKIKKEQKKTAIGKKYAAGVLKIK